MQDSYVASQTWDADAQTLTLAFTDKDALPVDLAGLQVLLARRTEARDDRRPEFTRQVGVYVAQADLHPGKWVLQVEAVARDGTLFRLRIDLFVKG